MDPTPSDRTSPRDVKQGLRGPWDRDDGTEMVAVRTRHERVGSDDAKAAQVRAHSHQRAELAVF